MKTESGGAAGSGLDLDLGAGATGFDFVAGVGCGAGGDCIYTRSAEGGTSSGLFWGWAVALGFNFMGIG